MKQVINHIKGGGLLNMIRRTDPMIYTIGADKGLSIDDQYFAKADKDISVFILHGDGNVYGGYYSSKRQGIDMYLHVNKHILLNDVINGKTSLKQIADFYKKK